MRKFAIVLFVLVFVVVVEAICVAFIGYNGSSWLPLYWLARLGEPLMEEPAFNWELAVRLALVVYAPAVPLAYAIDACLRTNVAQYCALCCGAVAWFVALIAAVTSRGEMGPGAPEYLMPTVLFFAVSIAVLGHSAYIALRRQR